MLLHTTGMELQELYFTLAAKKEELKHYKNVIQILDDYFLAKGDVPFQRHVFQQMEQQSERKGRSVCVLTKTKGHNM